MLLNPIFLHLQALLNGESIFAILGNPMVQLNLRLLYNIGSHPKVELPATKVVTHSEVGLLYWQSPTQRWDMLVVTQRWNTLAATQRWSYSSRHSFDVVNVQDNHIMIIVALTKIMHII